MGPIIKIHSLILLFFMFLKCESSKFPIVINTWAFQDATKEGSLRIIFELDLCKNNNLILQHGK